jgi:excisionase family DNA binding protein
MKEVLNAHEACGLLQIAKPTLYRHVRSGDIPAFRIGKALRFHKESLEKWMELRVAEDTSARKRKA